MRGRSDHRTPAKDQLLETNPSDRRSGTIDHEPKTIHSIGPAAPALIEPEQPNPWGEDHLRGAMH